MAVDGIIAIDAAGLVQLFNPACERLFGYAAGEVLGRNVAILMPSPYREEHDGYLARYLRTGERRIIGKPRIVTGRRKDGSSFPLELHVEELGLEGGRIFAGFLRDVTERLTAERSLHEAQAELRHVARLADMGEMASTLAHELTQPLSAVVNYLESVRHMLDGAGGIASGDVRELMDQALRQAARAGQIIHRLRAFMRKGEGRRGPEDLNGIVVEASELALLGATAAIDVTMALDPGLPAVVCDRIQIQQVVLNLVRNAVEALEGMERRKLAVGTARHEDGILVSVRDSGPGLAPEVAERLFQPFVTTKADGMGLGLSICRSIVEAHEGRLWSRPAPDGGTVFCFVLPALPGGHGRAS